MAFLRQSRCKDRHTFSPYWQNCLPFMKLCMLPYQIERGLHGLYVILSSYNPRNPRPQKNERKIMGSPPYGLFHFLHEYRYP